MQKITMALQELENQTQNKTLISLHNNIMVFIKVVKRVHPIECALLRFSYLEILFDFLFFSLSISKALPSLFVLIFWYELLIGTVRDSTFLSPLIP